MKIEVIENSKIKVTLTFEDLVYHNLKPEKLSADSPGLHRFLFSVMENIRRETGFNPYKGAVAVEAVQSREGMVLYITGLHHPTQNIGKNVVINGVEKKIRVCVRKNVTAESRYCFDNFTNLCDVLKVLSEKTLEVSMLYEYKEKWYFVHKHNEDFERSHCRLSEYCSEYGSIPATEVFLSEHGKLIASGESLISLAQGLKNMD